MLDELHKHRLEGLLRYKFLHLSKTVKEVWIGPELWCVFKNTDYIFLILSQADELVLSHSVGLFLTSSLRGEHLASGTGGLPMWCFHERASLNTFGKFFPMLICHQFLCQHSPWSSWYKWWAPLVKCSLFDRDMLNVLDLLCHSSATATLWGWNDYHSFHIAEEMTSFWRHK